jgi:hypothetical protein
MSTFDLFYLGMVITGMILFLAVLAWAMIYTRGAKTPEPAAKEIPAEPAPVRRAA